MFGGNCVWMLETPAVQGLGHVAGVPREATPCGVLRPPDAHPGRRVKLPLSRLYWLSHFNRIPSLFSRQRLQSGHASGTSPLPVLILDYCYEENISAQRTETRTCPWFSRPHGHQGWPQRSESPPRQGAQAPVRIIQVVGPGVQPDA